MILREWEGHSPRSMPCLKTLAYGSEVHEGGGGACMYVCHMMIWSIPMHSGYTISHAYAIQHTPSSYISIYPYSVPASPPANDHIHVKPHVPN